MPENLSTTLSDGESDISVNEPTKLVQPRRRINSKASGTFDLNEAQSFIDKCTKDREQIRSEFSGIRDTNHNHTKRIHNLRLEYEDARGRLDRLLRKTTPMSRNEKSDIVTSPTRRSADESDKDYGFLDYTGLDYSKRANVDTSEYSRRRGSRDSEVFDYEIRRRDSPEGEYYRRSSFRGSEDGGSRRASILEGNERRGSQKDVLSNFHRQYSRQRSSSIEIEHTENVMSLARHSSSGSSDVANGDRSPLMTQTSEISMITTDLTQPKPKGFQMVSLRVKVEDD